MKEDYSYPLLNKAPPHDSPEFIDYLRENNVVVHENDWCIIIENCKYHTVENPHLTVFKKKGNVERLFVFILSHYPDWEWLKKRKDHQTVKRFHIHLIK